MASELNHSCTIAGLSFSVRAPAPFGEQLSRAWRAFALTGQPEIRIELSLLPGEAPPGPRALPELEISAEGLRVRGDLFEGWASPDRKTATLDQRMDQFATDSLVKVLLAERLLSQGGLLVHGVGLAHQGSGALFVGASGAGKSTLGGLCGSAGLTLLADELVAVRREEEGYWIEGTPWNLGRPGRARLALVGALAWGESHHLEPMPQAELLRLLLPNSLLPDPRPEGRAQLFRAASDLLLHTRVARLRFARDRGVAKLLASELEPTRCSG